MKYVLKYVLFLRRHINVVLYGSDVAISLELLTHCTPTNWSCKIRFFAALATQSRDMLFFFFGVSPFSGSGSRCLWASSFTGKRVFLFFSDIQANQLARRPRGPNAL